MSWLVEVQVGDQAHVLASGETWTATWPRRDGMRDSMIETAA